MRDIDYMQRSLELARRGEFTARPNPLVGALVVAGDGALYEGCHEYFGAAHAEVNALEAAGSAAHGATLYVTLEPCCHQGKTGPCTQRVIEAGIARVVFGMRDPNPEVSGQGLAQLEAAGIEVVGPVLEDEARALNPGFIKRMTRAVPYTRVKMAMSLDGRTAMASGESQWITGPAAREDVQRWRARSDAVVSGVETVLADEPSLNVRLDIGNLRQPLRVIVDSRLRTPPTAKLLQLPGPVLIATALDDEALHSAAAAYRKLDDVEVLGFPGAGQRVDLTALWHHLASRRECGCVLVESGSTLAGAVLHASLADELISYVAPKLLGAQARPLLALPDIERLDQHVALAFQDVEILGKDCRMRSLIL